MWTQLDPEPVKDDEPPLARGEPAVEDARTPEPVAELVETPPVTDHVAQAARRLSIQIWSDVVLPRAQLAPANDQALAHAVAMNWLVVDAKDRIVQGVIDPRPVTVTRIPNWLVLQAIIRALQ